MTATAAAAALAIDISSLGLPVRTRPIRSLAGDMHNF